MSSGVPAVPGAFGGTGVGGGLCLGGGGSAFAWAVPLSLATEPLGFGAGFDFGTAFGSGGGVGGGVGFGVGVGAAFFGGPPVLLPALLVPAPFLSCLHGGSAGCFDEEDDVPVFVLSGDGDRCQYLSRG